MDWNAILVSVKETVLMTIISSVSAYLVGVPLGVLLHVTSKNGIHPNRFINLVLGLLVNILRSVPCLILVVLCMPWVRAWFGVASGEWYTMIIPLFMASFAFVARMVEQSISEVDLGEVDAVRSMGATDWQLVTKVLLPEAFPSLISGFAVSSVSILGYTSFAYNIGAGGLISDIWQYYARHTGDFTTSLFFWLMIVMVVIIVQVIQELGLFISRKVDKRRKLK